MIEFTIFVGSNTDLPVLILNSHYDVVPVDEANWTVPAFDGHMSSDNKIYGRGAQDMKCVLIQYIISIRKLKSINFQPKR